MDGFERVRRLREDYESALDEAEKHRADYHREIVKLHRSGMSLREIADQLGISHQRVHQIVGVAEERSPSGRLAGGVAGAVIVLLAAGIWLAGVRGSGGELPIAAPSTARDQPSLDRAGRGRTTPARCFVLSAGSESAFTPITISALASRCPRRTTVVIDANTGRVLAVVQTTDHGRRVLTHSGPASTVTPQ